MRGILGLLAILMLLAACAPPPYLYYGNSSHSYYRAVKKQDTASVEQYKKSLQDVFDRSARMGIPVPPGLYCDYALIMMKEERPDLATEYFEKERSTWAESDTMVNFLLQRYGLKQ